MGDLGSDNILVETVVDLTIPTPLSQTVAGGTLAESSSPAKHVISNVRTKASARQYRPA